MRAERRTDSRGGRLHSMLVLAAVLTAYSGAAFANHSSVKFWKSSRKATSEAGVDVHATTSQVYAAVTDYGRWPQLFRDVKWVKVKSGGRRDAVVQFASRALGHTVTVRFDNEEPRTVRFKLVDGPRGARASGQFFMDALGEGVTRIQGALYMDVVGFVGFFVPDSTIRRKRDAKLRSDLQDLLQRFAEPPSPRSVP